MQGSSDHDPDSRVGQFIEIDDQPAFPVGLDLQPHLAARGFQSVEEDEVLIGDHLLVCVGDESDDVELQRGVGQGPRDEQVPSGDLVR